MFSRTSLVASIFALCTGLAVAQTPLAAPVAPVPAVAPAQTFTKPTGQLPNPPALTTVPDGTRYLNNPGLLVFSTEQVAKFNTEDADILFLGDSITQGWLGRGKEIWEAEFAPRKALNFGISGDQTQHVLWRMDNYPIARLHPRLAVVLIGTNNAGNTPAEIADGVHAILLKTQAMYPGIKIILNSIMPRSRVNEKMMAANTILRGFADGKTIVYLDLVPVMTPVGDNFKGLGPDHLHPDASGYRLWADALLPLVDKLLPKP